MNRLRMAVIGVGALGRHHARILSNLEHVELVAVVDPRPDVGQNVATACECSWFAAPEAVYNQVDAVSIVVPTVLHAEVAGPFLERGIAVLLEKPLTANLAEAESLVQLADSKLVPLQIGHIERFNPATAVAWRNAGKPKYIRAERASTYTFRSTDIGVVLDLMIHDLDLVLDLVNSPLESVEAFGISVFGGHEDTATARLRFKNGCIADLTASRTSPVAQRGMQIWSDEGCTTVDFTERTVDCYQLSGSARYGSPVYQRAAEPGANVEQLKADVFGKLIRVARLPVPEADALTAELQSFIQCLRTGRPTIVGGTEGLAAIRAADAVLGSIAAHRWDGTDGARIGPFVIGDVDQNLRKAG